MTEIVIASSNQGKISEFKAITDANPELNYSFSSIADYCTKFEVEETGDSFYANALLKAQAGAKVTQRLCLADDSGITIEALGGKPGIYSKRFLNEQGGVDGVLKLMQEQTNRKCFFTCCLIIANPQGKVVFAIEQNWSGTVAQQARGDQGFGYDPIVVPDEYHEQNKTIAQLDSKIKNQISHRALAMKKLVDYLTGSLQDDRVILDPLQGDV